MKYALVSNQYVADLVLWDGESEWTPPAGLTPVKCPDGIPVSPGWSYVDGEFSPPPAPEPLEDPAA